MKAAAAMVIVWAFGASAAGPPRVVEAVPDHGDVGVGAGISALTVTFDQDMMGGFSLCGGGPAFPELRGRPWWRDPRTLVVPVALEPGRRYELSVNCPAAQNFRGVAGEPAEVYPIVFRTGGDGEPAPVLGAGEAAQMTAALRRAIDERYSHRDARGVDWDELFERAGLEGSATPAAFARAAAGLLRSNDDLHVWVEVNGVRMGTGRRAVAPNVDVGRLWELVPGWRQWPGGAAGRFGDGVGYLAVTTWAGDGAALEPVLAALEELADAPGLVVDVRLNAGGNEELARRFAACFVERATVYSRNTIRDPAAPGGWAGPFDRVVEPARDGPRYGGRVAVLMGPACMSSCESFLLMMRRPGRREWFGDRSWGSSGNPRPHELGGGVRVYLSSWRDTTPGGDPIEGSGLEPDHAVPWPGDGGDPVLDAALRWLRGS